MIFVQKKNQCRTYAFLGHFLYSQLNKILKLIVECLVFFLLLLLFDWLLLNWLLLLLFFALSLFLRISLLFNFILLFLSSDITLRT